jgi:hypothetical protein
MVIRDYVFFTFANPNSRSLAAAFSPPVVMSSDIIALSAIDVEALKQRLNTLVASTSSPSVLMPSDIVALPAADAEVLKQRLDALVTTTEAAEEKAAAVHHRDLAARQLLDKEQAAVADLERQAAAKKLVPGSTSSSTTETVTTSPSYVHRHQLPHPGGYHDGGNPPAHIRSSCCSDGVLLQQNVAHSTVAALGTASPAWQEQRPRQR